MNTEMQNLIRPPWIELLKLRRKVDFDTAAARLFGLRPKNEFGERKPYTAEEYFNRFAIKIMDYHNFYAEVGATDAPVGPNTPATESLPVWPILGIRRTRSSAWTVHGLKLTRGLFSKDKSRAWVKVDDYEELLGDNFFQEVLDETEKIKQAAAKHAPSQNKLKVRVSDIPDDLTPQERQIIEQILKK